MQNKKCSKNIVTGKKSKLSDNPIILSRKKKNQENFHSLSVSNNCCSSEKSRNYNGNIRQTFTSVDSSKKKNLVKYNQI